MLLTQTRTVTVKPLLSTALKMVCVHQDLRALWCILFSSFPIFFPQSVPKPIALEPCFGNKAAVLSIFVRLPRGTGGIPPPGQSGKTQPLKSFTCFSFLTCLFDWASLFYIIFPWSDFLPPLLCTVALVLVGPWQFWAFQSFFNVVHFLFLLLSNTDFMIQPPVYTHTHQLQF